MAFELTIAVFPNVNVYLGSHLSRTSGSTKFELIEGM